MGELPRYLTSDNFNVVISKLIQKPKIIFVDEIDIESIKKLFKVCELRSLKPHRIKNTMALNFVVFS